MKTVLTLKVDSSGNEMLASAEVDRNSTSIVLKFMVNGEITSTKEYPFSQSIVDMIRDINNEIDKAL